MYPPEVKNRIEELRQLAQTRDLTATEQAEVVTLIRQDRVSASYASRASKERKAAAKPDGAALLAKLTAALGGGKPA